MRTRQLAVALMIVFLASVQVAADEWKSLFDGKSLKGWEGDETLWSVQDGSITGITNDNEPLPYNKFLIATALGEVGDFHFKTSFRLEGKNNSGVQYRSAQLKDAGDFVVGGYQADIHGNAPYTAMLYDERGRGILAQRGQKVVVAKDGKVTVVKQQKNLAAVDLTKWHTLEIIAIGAKIVHKLDGEVAIEISDYDEKDRELSGIIALQVHRGPAMKVQFKDMAIKILDKQKEAGGDVGAVPNWIWPEGAPAETTVVFSKEFSVPGNRVGGVRLSGTADNSYVFTVNGKEVLSGGDWQKVSGTDIRAHVRNGKNLLQVKVRNSGGPGGLIARLEIEMPDKSVKAIVSDDTWFASVDGGENVAPKPLGKAGIEPWSVVTIKSFDEAVRLRTAGATPASEIQVAEGFKAELLYSVPQASQGSWVNLCVIPDGTLVVSDQYGQLYSVMPKGIKGAEETSVTQLQLDIGEAQGLVWAFDSLYVVVNKGRTYESGVYRVTDADKDGTLDSVKQLISLTGGGEHGPHAVVPTPDGTGLIVVCGNQTKMIDMQTSLVPQTWDEDLILPRTYGRGFMRGVPAPGGFIFQMDPNGENRKLIATGFRNQFDAAFNRYGDLFTYDADMEWDVNTPWYRPTRVCHVTDGAEFGWRNGSGKWPSYMPDSLPSIVDIGPGSPTGIAFGYGTAFPSKYQEALYICDWSYGKMYAVHLSADGTSYAGTLEEFVSASPLPLTDVIVNPVDKALYFAIGGRRVKSGLYRVTYVGEESTNPAAQGLFVRSAREQLEATFLSEGTDDRVELALKHLGSDDRHTRFAARIALEHTPVDSWSGKISEQGVDGKLAGIMAMARSNVSDLRGDAIELLLALRGQEMTPEQRLFWLRDLQLVFLRLGEPNAAERVQFRKVLGTQFPTGDRVVDIESLKLLVYLEDEAYSVSRGLPLMLNAPTQEEQIDYAAALRLAKGWTIDQRSDYFNWFHTAASYRGGASFQMFLENIRKEAIELLSAEEKDALETILANVPDNGTPIKSIQREFVKKWSKEEVAAIIANDDVTPDFVVGRSLFGQMNCFACHRFAGEGGAIGPDLTGIAGRFNATDLADAIVDPSRVVSDQFAATTFITTEGRIITGRIANLSGDNFMIQTNMMDPSNFTRLDRKLVDESFLSKTSLMPEGLLDTLNSKEIKHLMTFLLSRGEKSADVYKK
ncbi:MAG: family 16 glycoside hydrolase [Pirellulaceae bacterium]